MKVGLLTSGGDCQSLNATMRGFVKTLYHQDKSIEIIGFLNGYKGLMNCDYKVMKASDFSGILNVGGTILGTSRCPFKKMKIIEDGFDKVEAMKKTYKKLNLDCLVVLGGNGSLKSANMLQEEGLNVIALPKTIDNDTFGTDYTFGFQSAVDVATRYLDEMHTTADSHSRVFVVEVMGHKVGHITLASGLASGADIILLPEIPYDIKEVVKAIENREKHGKRFSIIACSEGAISKADAALSKKEYDAKVKNRKGGSVVYEIAEQLSKYINNEIRVSCIGHIQRGGMPCAYDRMISTRFGIEGARLVLTKTYNKLVVLDKEVVTSIPLKESAGKIKYVDINSKVIRNAKLMGVSFGD